MAKLLNQGAYGCVYYPGFTCKGNIDKTKKYVTKIEIFDKTSKNELDISKRVKDIKNFQKFFSPVVKHCISRFKQLSQHRTQLEECEPVNISENIYNDFIMIYIKYIKGKELEKYILDIESPAIYISSIINNYFYLLASIKKLQHKHIIHYDLHTGNILYDLDKNRSIIIDFGLSIDSRKIFTETTKTSISKAIDYRQLKKSTMHYSPKHYTYPPELHFITYLLEDINSQTDTDATIEQHLHQNITRENIDLFIEDMIEYNKIQKRYIYYKNLISSTTNIATNTATNTTTNTATNTATNTTNKYTDELRTFYNQFLGKTRKEAIDIIAPHIKTLDQYTLTIDICVILIKLIDRLSESKNHSLTNMLFLILEILIFNLQIDPTERMSIDESQELITALFKLRYHHSTDKSRDKSTIKKLISRMSEYHISPDFRLLQDEKIQDLLK